MKNTVNFKARFYQEEGIQACVDILTSINKNCREIVIAPTGAGKSWYTAETVRRIDEPIIIIQPSRELLLQNYEKYLTVGGKATVCCASLKTKTVKGVEYAELEDGSFIKCREVSKVTFCTVGSVIKHIEELKKLGVKKILVDECFPYKTPINTEEGLINIGDIVKKFKKGIDLPKVKSYNENTNNFEYKKVIAAKYMGEKPVVKTLFTTGSLESTLNHKVLTTTGWKKIEDLSIGDAVKTSYEEEGHGYLDLSEEQKAIIVGSGIGDGSFDYRQKNSNIARMKFIHGTKQQKYLQWKSSIMTSDGKVRFIEKNGYSQKNAYAFTTQCFYMPENQKNDDWLIENLTLKSLAVLWMDDGHMSKGGQSGSLYAFCHKPNKLKKLKLKIEQLGITGTVFCTGKSSSTGAPLCYLRFKKEAIKNISEKCAKYIHSELSYKVNSENRVEVGSYKWDNKPNGIIKVVRGFKDLGVEKVYDIEVEGNHNFIVANKSAYKRQNSKNIVNRLSLEGIIVHNCHLMTQSTTQNVKGRIKEKPAQIKKLMNLLGATHMCGLTATSLYLQGGTNGATLKIMTRVKWRLFTNIRHVTQISQLVEKGYWSKLKYQINKTDETVLEHNKSGSDYTVESLKKFYVSNNLKDQIIEEIENLKKEGRKSIMVFLNSIEEADDLYKDVPNSAIVHSKIDLKTRAYFIKEFKSLEIPVIFNVNCLDTKTEILTDKGWVKHNEITYEHKVANWKDGEIYFEKPLNIIHKHTKDEEFMCTYETKEANFRVTNNHDMLIKHQSDSTYKKEKAEFLLEGSRRMIPLHGIYNPPIIEVEQEKRNLKSSIKRRIVANSFNLRKNDHNLSIEDSHKIAKERIVNRDSLKYKNPHELTADECFLIGFFLGDGCRFETKKDGYRYSISQSKRYPKIIKKIDEVLNSSNIHYTKRLHKEDKKSIHKSYTWEISTGTGYGPQKKNGIFKLIPYLDKNGSKYLKYLNKDKFEDLLYGLWMADGNHGDGYLKKDSHGRGRLIHSSNLGLLDLLQEISVARSIKTSIKKSSKLRKSHHKQMYKFSYSNSLGHVVNNRKIVEKEIVKNEKVWCVTTSSGNIVTRRDFKTTVMGNCLATGFDHPLVDALITVRPTSSISVFYQQIGRGVRIHEDKEDCKVVDFSGNVSKFGKVEDLYYENVPGYGYGLFGKGDILLSDYPLVSKIRPTKQSLINAGAKKEKSKNINSNFKFPWGKYKGRSLLELSKTKEAPKLIGYCSWLLKQHEKGDFILKGSIYNPVKEYLESTAKNFTGKVKSNTIKLDIPNKLF